MTADPQPRVTARVCSLCGLDWNRHGKKPTAETCIGLLLDEVRSLNARLASRPFVSPWPYPVTIPQPYPVPYYPRLYWSGWGGGTYTNTTAMTPAAATAQPLALPQSTG